MALAAGIGALGSLLGAGIGGAFSMASSRRAFEYAKALQQHQYNLQQQGYREGPSNARQGFEDAGYNPILALTNGSGFSGSVAGGTPVGTNQPDIPDLGKSMSNAYQTFKLNKQSVNNQTLTSLATADQANAQAELNKEQAITEQAKRTQMEFQNAMYDVEKHLKEKELSWADRKFYSEIYDNMQRAENYGAMASIARYNAKTERENMITNAFNADTARMNARTNRWDVVKGRQLENARYELDKIEAPFRMTRDIMLPLATYGLSSKYSTNAQQSYGHHSQYDYYRSGFSTRSH